MLKIGDFANLFSVTIKTVRFYEEKELLKPCYVDKYSGYSYKFTTKKNKLYSVVKIDYKKHDMKKFVYDNVAMKNFINEKKQFTLDGAIDYYESMGAICKK